jgi:small-conductance mechanosensitive channel
MKFWRRLSVLIPAAVLLVSLVGIFLTRGVMANLPFLKSRQSRANAGDLVDQRPWQTAQALASAAVSTEEHEYAREALRLSDHEVDQAFAQALRQASTQTKPLNAQGQALQQRVAALGVTVQEDQAQFDRLTAALKAVPAAGSARRGAPAAPVVTSDDVDVAKAQLQLDTDELADANEDLARMSGDKRGQIQQELTDRDASTKKYETQNEGTAQTSTMSAKRFGTLSGRLGGWFDQRTRMDMLKQAQDDATAGAAALTGEHAQVEASLGAAQKSGKTAAESKASELAEMHSLVKVQGILDDRIQTLQQLATVYGRWLDQVKMQHGIVEHMILRSVALIAFLILCGTLVSVGVGRLLDRLTIDARSLHAMKTVVTLGIQLLNLLLVLFVIFGVPSQMPTILGLATAGLTVVFQDFILAFFGWFVLMGKNGMRDGDWVEINGVGGEVVQITMFRTYLLETGNWTDKGHPTGRTVTFMNSFAITGHYFNFSTSGQWMWDEIRVNLPAGVESYKAIEAIQASVAKETEEDTKLADSEWGRASQRLGLKQFGATPTVSQRPAASGVDVVVRYVTRASDRYEVRNKVYQAVIDLMHPQEEASVGAGNKP